MLLPLIYIVVNSDFITFNNFLILLISFISNTFSAISGGGAGFIQLPALLLSGIPYYQALATHKVATVALGLGGSIRNISSLKKDVYILWQLIFFGTPGVILILGLFSIFLSLYSFFKTSLGQNSSEYKINFRLKLSFVILIFFIGILNGSISSGTGLLVTISLIKYFEIDFLRAVSLTFFSVGIFWNALGAIFLSRIGSIPINLLVILLLGSFAGGYFGAHLSNLKGNKLIKNTFTVVCLIVGISLLSKSIGQMI